ncbi:uncharacterized protein M437DRAFT_85001 [Aureobasidium melanogenum CBS 110374]|uniref:Uncharacterized protein n=1 Tax=Aureobasidium melanogenum (strain CBS 110374) TaxID=1043003 RepID=A0A074VMZ0_AURM1|nr:uncharacterized protein M437DRAFT_85001 [Aureobasidium melanogenum CBS 110374]KEQ62090.1 hypothetical protein M437DRAFT_85001 [Aureobasidium melanogenum CBS 110374]
MATTSKSPKRVSWACPLVKSTSSFLPIQQQQNSSCFNNRDAHDPVQICRPAANNSHDILQDSTSSQPGSCHDSLSLNNALKTITLPRKEREAYENQQKTRARYQHREEQEKWRYAQSRLDREQELLCRDAFYQDPYAGICWTATCKFVDVLASRDVEPKLERRFTKSDLLVTLFVNGDFTFSSRKLWLDGLLIPLVIDFPQVKNFRFAVFFSRSLVEEKREVPEALKYLFGTFRYMKRTATLQGATTEMEKKFVRKQLHERRRARFDHVQIHEDSLKQGVLIAKVDEDDVNGSPMDRNLLEEVPMAAGLRPIDIRWPKVKEKGWKAPKEGSVWA